MDQQFRREQYDKIETAMTELGISVEEKRILISWINEAARRNLKGLLETHDRKSDE